MSTRNLELVFTSGRADAVSAHVDRRFWPVTSPLERSPCLPPPGIEPGYVGPAVLPGSGRLIWWTGRVAIGLRAQPLPPPERPPVPASQLWLQKLLLDTRPTLDRSAA